MYGYSFSERLNFKFYFSSSQKRQNMWESLIKKEEPYVRVDISVV